jgi:NAD(P)-dependent dehydrogenase (short-subunit alcohol dehydrogenase family)
VAKAGLNNLTQYLARELAPHGIRVNAIAPGFFPAEQNRLLLSEDRIKAIIGHTPARRLGEAGELVGTAIWLASARASGFVTGAIVRVDGGFTAMTI